MPVHDLLFRTLADPTRRALFERLCREGEQTVGALTAHGKVSQPAVSKHLGVLKLAGLVPSTSEAMRTVDGGGVRIDGEKVSDKGLLLVTGNTVVLQVGKRKFARVTLA